jgi:hypothetical protein
MLKMSVAWNSWNASRATEFHVKIPQKFKLWNNIVASAHDNNFAENTTLQIFPTPKAHVRHLNFRGALVLRVIDVSCGGRELHICVLSGW